MIFVALGSNLAGAAAAPVDNCKAALNALAAAGVAVVRRSRWYRSPPWPPSEQPWYVNAVAELKTDLAPAALLELLHATERSLGRTRAPGVLNAARTVDLDLIDYDAMVRPGPAPILPHPRLADRAFVLRPLAELAPDWVHPKTGRSIKDLLAALPADAVAAPIFPQEI